MNRRAFLTRLAAAAAGTAVAATVDWERLLWTPGATQYVDLWTPPTFRAGDLVAMNDQYHALTDVRDESGRLTHVFAMVRPRDLRLLDARGLGKIGVVTEAVAKGGFAQVQLYGPTTVRCAETESGRVDIVMNHPRLTHAVV